MHGKNLAVPPEFSASSFPNLEDYIKLGDFLNVGNQPANNQTANVDSKVAASPDAGYIYFKNSFRLDSAAQTDQLVASFLKDFTELKGLPLENLEAKKIVVIDLSVVKNTNTVVAKIKKNAAVKSFDVKTNALEFKQEKYQEEVVNFLKIISPDITLKTEFQNNLDYIARLNYTGSKVDLTSVLKKLKDGYGDVVSVR